MAQSTNALLDELRNLYKKNNFFEFMKLYQLGGWMLPAPERAKIDATINVWRSRIHSEASPVILKAKELFPGSKIVP